MSMFLCPLCGKQNSIEKYHPENFEDDVEIFHNVGLGRGKGLEKKLGYNFEDFPDLKVKLGERVNRISGFFELQTEAQLKTSELKSEIDEERKQRIAAEEELEELDIKPLLIKVNQVLDTDFIDIHLGVDELIKRATSINNSLKDQSSKYDNLQSRCSSLEQTNKKLGEYNKQWEQAYRDLEKNTNQKISEYSTAYNRERDKRIKLEEYIDELDLDLLLHNVNNAIYNEYENLHSAVNELIYDLNSCEKEIKNALDFINNVLPEEYDIFDDLDVALEAVYQFYEDYVEELEG